jgi:hypothetical protein
MAGDIIISIAVATAIVLIFNQLARVVRTMILHRTIRKGMIHNSALTPELLDRIETQKPETAFGDDRIGLVLLAIGLAIIGFGIIQGDPDDIRNTAGVALFPLFVGAVLFGRHIYLARRAPAADA